VPLRPAEVHPQEHLGPVGRLRASGPCADREDGISFVVFATEQKGGPQATERGGEAIELRGQVDLERRVVTTGGEFVQLGEIAGPPLELPPGPDFVAQVLGLPEDALGRLWVVPEPGLGGLVV
jgi:hypothetical protein